MLVSLNFELVNKLVCLKCLFLAYSRRISQIVFQLTLHLWQEEILSMLLVYEFLLVHVTTYQELTPLIFFHFTLELYWQSILVLFLEYYLQYYMGGGAKYGKRLFFYSISTLLLWFDFLRLLLHGSWVSLPLSWAIFCRAFFVAQAKLHACFSQVICTV